MAEQKTETTVNYDDRRKEMVQFIRSTQEIKIDNEVVGDVAIERKATFQEAGIRKIIKDLANQQTKLEQTIKQIKENLKNVKDLTPELKKLEENLKIINDFNKSEQMNSQVTSQEADLKIVKKDILDIKDAIGSRLKL